MTRFLLNPSFDIETGALVSHDGESFEDPVILFDRSAVQAAKENRKQTDATAGKAEGSADVERAGVIPGLLRDANNPNSGFTPEQVNNMMVIGAQPIGGVNSGIMGEAELGAARTRNAGGFTNALDEAARIKGRQLSDNALQVATRNADVGLQKQQEARRQLEGMYGVDTSNMLKAMGMSNDALQTQLAAGRQGWLQNTLNTINTITGSGKDVAQGGKAAGLWG